MSIASNRSRAESLSSGGLNWGLVWLILAFVSAGALFAPGLQHLIQAWQVPEYSHGPLIPVLSLLLFLRQLREVPVEVGPKPDRWPGVALIGVSLLLAAVGRLSQIGDFVAYALILWVGGLLLVSFGWRTGKSMWPPVLHLVFMLPLPGYIYFTMTTQLQLISSEIGVAILKAASVPVFLEGNVIDLGVYRLHVAEACSGLRYLFPIMSFSYIFAVLYRGPMWHKAVLLLSAAPITVLMNSVRIGIAGIIVNTYGLEWVEGFSHFFEGWVIFLTCIVILFGLARVMLYLHPSRMSLTEALDLDTDGLLDQARRVRFVMPSPALITSVVLLFGAVGMFQFAPERAAYQFDRDSFALFPRTLGDWDQEGPPRRLSASVADVLAADDYHSVTFQNSDTERRIRLLMTWYEDESQSGGVHSPRLCLPGGGWEIAEIERIDIGDRVEGFDRFRVTRAIIQAGQTRQLVLFWYQQKGRQVASDLEAKLRITLDGVLLGRRDDALIRVMTPISRDETEDDAEARIVSFINPLMPHVPRFIPGR